MDPANGSRREYRARGGAMGRTGAFDPVPRCSSCGTEGTVLTAVEVQASAIGFVDCPRCDRTWFVRDGHDAHFGEVVPLLARFLGAPAEAARRSGELAPIVHLGQIRRVPNPATEGPERRFG